MTAIGTRIQQILEQFGVQERSGCGCSSYAALLDGLGINWVKQNKEIVINRLEEQAKIHPVLKFLPMKRLFAEFIVDKAIKLEEQAAETKPILNPYTYITTERLIKDTLEVLAPKLDTPDLVVGVSRSGLTPATTLATIWNCPLAACDLKRVYQIGTGIRSRNFPDYFNGDQPSTILIVDDTMMTAQTITYVTEIVRNRWSSAKITTAVVYSATGITTAKYAFILPPPHYLEWNLFNSTVIQNAGVDLDGVLCGQNNRRIQRPQFLPIEAIISARGEQFRVATEKWLADNKINYKQLVLSPTFTFGPDAGKFKAEAAKTLGLKWFIESDLDQAEVITKEANIPVLCMETKNFLLPNDVR